MLQTDTDERRSPLPELLAPAGSRSALEAAIEAGADAVYMAGRSFGARAYAENFSSDGLRDAIALCHKYGVRSYITMNTMVYEKELPLWLATAKDVWDAGADAFIVADLGASCLLKKAIPDVRLHASTQMSVHNSRGANVLSTLGFSRVVLARELSFTDLCLTAQRSLIETEAFIHGALCVSSSGQCLLSAMIGGRSGNRGECAQPCRLPYNGMPLLSLKDNCLASHMTKLLSSGVSSLKIEGRMKPAPYVYRVTKVYRTLLDERRNATPDEMAALEEAFSRSGFTDGYFTGIKTGMTGIRTEEDKQKSSGLSFGGLTRHLPLQMDCRIKKEECPTLTVSGMGRTVTVCADKHPEPAQTRPLDEETVKRCLQKLGNTPYVCDGCRVDLDGGLMMFIGELNDLRRRALAALEAGYQRPSASSHKSQTAEKDEAAEKDGSPRELAAGASARFSSPEQMKKLPKDAFSRRYLPLSLFEAGAREANGVVLPPLCYEREDEHLEKRLTDAARAGARYALCSNLSQLSLCRRLGYGVTADFRFNCASNGTMTELLRLGADEVILSPELSLSDIRKIGGVRSVIVYGYQPVMLTEHCFGKDTGFCSRCQRGEAYTLKDRTGAVFSALPTEGHRMLIFNSVPTYMADKRQELASVGKACPHFLFTTESADEVVSVIEAYRTEQKRNGNIRRIRK